MEYKGDEFMKLYVTSGEELLKNKKLSRADLVVLFYMGLNVKFGTNLIYTNPEKISKFLGITKRSVYLSLAKLEKMKYIQSVDDKETKDHVYLITAEAMTKGSSEPQRKLKVVK